MDIKATFTAVVMQESRLGVMVLISISLHVSGGDHTALLPPAFINLY